MDARYGGLSGRRSPSSSDFAGTASLLARAAQGDQRAWDQLVEGHNGLLWAVARSFQLDAADANDVVQTTWLRLLEHLDRIEDPTRLVGWLVTTARREAMRVLRRSSREQVTPEQSILDDVDGGLVPDARVLMAERDAALWRGYGRLSERDRQVLRLVVSEERSYHEAAQVLGMSPSAVGAARTRALVRLRDVLADQPRVPTCETCGVPLERRTGPGRPRRYCSSECRR